jgi:transposase InsO family protein
MDLGLHVASVKFFDQGPRGPVHRLLRRRVHRRRHQDSHQPAAGTRANAICERITGTLRRELFDRLLIVGEHHLRQVLTEYLRHYNTGRPHRALGQLAPAQADTRPPEPINLTEYRIRRKPVLGGLIHEYQIAA